MLIEAKCSHSEQRARDFFRFHLLVRNISKYIYYGLFLIAVGTGFYYIEKNNIDYAIYAFIFGILVLIVKHATVISTVNRILKNYKFPVVVYYLKFFDEYVLYDQEMSKKQYLWKDILRVDETKVYFYFYISPNSALILPKYVLKDNQQDEIIKLVKQNNVKYRRHRIFI